MIVLERIEQASLEVSSRRMGALDARRSRNALAVGNLASKGVGYFDIIGITFALLTRFRELMWIELGLLCIGLIGRRSPAIQEGRTSDSDV